MDCNTPEPAGRNAFLDTTVPGDRILGDDERKALTKKKLRGYASLASSKYVQLEFGLSVYGPMADLLARAQGGASVAEVWSVAVRYATGPPQYKWRRVGSVMLKTITFFIRKLESDWRTGEAPAEQLRGFLRKYVGRVWKKAFKGIDTVLDPSGCLGDLPEPRRDAKTKTMTNVVTDAYVKAKAPQLAAFIRRRTEFRTILDALEEIPCGKRDAETKRRIRALRRILVNAGQATSSDIRNVGDAFVAVECPGDHVLLSSHAKHFGLIAQAIGKVSESSFDG